MKISCLLLFALLSVLSQANAVLVDNGDYTTDTRTGLDWLDMSFSQGLSYNASIANNPGWRAASKSEVANLLGIPPFFRDLANYSIVKEVVDLLGATVVNLSYPTERHYLWGFTSDPGQVIGWPSGVVLYYGFNDEGPLDGSWVDNAFGSTSKDVGVAHFGTLLVRASSVPDTGSALGFFGFAILALIGLHRRFTR